VQRATDCKNAVDSASLLLGLEALRPAQRSYEKHQPCCLQANPSCRATGCDVSPTAVSCFQDVAAAAGISDDRLTTFVHDISAPAEQLAHCAADACLLIFTLSAVHPARMAAVLQAAYAALRPGGTLYVRDYGLYDMTSLRFPPEQRLDESLYFRCADQLACVCSTSVHQRTLGLSSIACRWKHCIRSH
jgi:SAM-dependent methyltransferase